MELQTNSDKVTSIQNFQEIEKIPLSEEKIDSKIDEVTEVSDQDQNQKNEDKEENQEKEDETTKKSKSPLVHVTMRLHDQLVNKIDKERVKAGFVYTGGVSKFYRILLKLGLDVFTGEYNKKFIKRLQDDGLL